MSWFVRNLYDILIQTLFADIFIWYKKLFSNLFQDVWQNIEIAPFLARNVEKLCMQKCRIFHQKKKACYKRNSNASYPEFDIHSRCTSISLPLWSFSLLPICSRSPNLRPRSKKHRIRLMDIPSHVSHFLGFILSQLMSPAFRVTFPFRFFLINFSHFVESFRRMLRNVASVGYRGANDLSRSSALSLDQKAVSRTVSILLFTPSIFDSSQLFNPKISQIE